MDIAFFCAGPSAQPPEGTFPGGVGVYLHGDAEGEVGYDIPDSSVDLDALDEGVYPVQLNGEPGYTLYLWRARTRGQMLRGLVAKDSDAEGSAFAREQFEAKPSHL